MPVIAAPNQDPRDLAASAVRALVLYSLAEFQSGHATTIRITVEGTAFSIADDGRGHAIDRAIGGVPYLKFIYTQLDYPFNPVQGAPIQLQGIGMSFVNALCSELAVVVRKRDVTLRLWFQDGQLRGSERIELKSESTGNTISGTVSARFQRRDAGVEELRQWLLCIVAASPSLTLVLNGRQLQGPGVMHSSPDLREG
jgi:DNA gyrase/topoisomerase IV subunit B